MIASLTENWQTAALGGERQFFIFFHIECYRHHRNDVINRAMVRFGEGTQLPKLMLHSENTKLSVGAWRCYVFIGTAYLIAKKRKDE